MIWSIKIGDVISFPKDIYKYEVTDIQGNDAVIKNLLTHKYVEIKVSNIKKVAKIEKRKD